MPLKNKTNPVLETVNPNQIKCTDMKYLIHRTKSNPELMMEMISLYLEQTPPLLAAMRQSLIDKDWHSLDAAVHKMIPSFSIVGINKDFEDIAKKIQEFASTQKQIHELSDMVEQIETICTQACIELEEEFIRIKSNKA